MCVVSMVMDHYWDKWNPLRPLPYIVPQPTYPYTQPVIVQPFPVVQPITTPAEIEEFRKLLERAREYDRKNGEPDCELAEKRQKLMKLAEELGVKIDFL